jgi:hypothetical protein
MQNKILTVSLSNNKRLIFKIEDNVPVGRLRKIYEKKFFFCILKITEERSRIRIHLSRGSDPNQNVTDPQHW